MKIFKVAEDEKCNDCSWSDHLYVLADSQEKADKLYKMTTVEGGSRRVGFGACPTCLVNVLMVKQSEIKP